MRIWMVDEGAGIVRAWTVRGGQSGEREQAALSEGLAIVGWEELGDLSDCSSSDDIGDLLAKAYPGEAVGTIDNWKRQLWRFIAMEIGDYIVMPRKHLSIVALGLLTGPYEYRAAAPPGFRHVRRTDWVRPALERAAVRGDLRDSMGAFLTVSELSRRDAAVRVQALAETGADPGYVGDGEPPHGPEGLVSDVRDSGTRQLTARDLIGLWGWKRRTSDVIDLVDQNLAELGLRVDPHFNDVQLDGLVTVYAAEATGLEEGIRDQVRGDEQRAHSKADGPRDRDLTWRIGNLPFVREVVTVRKGDALSRAITPMIESDFSQLPVVDHNNVLRGVVTWEGIARAQLGGRTATVANALDPHPETARVEHALFDRMDRIQRSGFTIIVDGENTVIGILTSTDLAGQLKQRIEPFILLEELERRLRRLIRHFSTDELPREIRRTMERGQHLSLGQYVFLVEDTHCWNKLAWPFEQQDISRRLATVRDYRNDLAHWAVDAPAEDAAALAATGGLLKLLKLVDHDPAV
ncbi:CBS domain-containing protein [Streptomyces sp. NPDC058734]|uniref:CBS domain-containing protein n=1 Tax=Streptomyces sp. NPDC058734 TaxID=3346615 RepID=UPI0036D05340